MNIGNLEVYGIIYKIENLINSKVYIGQTIQKGGFKDRYSGNNINNPIEWVYNFHSRTYERSDTHCNEHLLNSMNKYGIDSFKVVEVFDVAFSEDELNTKEKCWISVYKSNNPKYGYNSTNGGDSFKFSDDSKVRDGNKIICINNNIVFKSHKEAIEYFDKRNVIITNAWITKACNIRRKAIFKYDKPLFMKYDTYISSYKGKYFCKSCGIAFERKNNSQKYCKDCSTIKKRKERTSFSKINEIKSFRKIPIEVQEYILINKNKKLSELVKYILDVFQIKTTTQAIKMLIQNNYLNNKLIQ